MPAIFTAIKSGAARLGKALERLFTSELVLVAGNCPEVLATARYWRDELNHAHVRGAGESRSTLQIEVSAPLTATELEEFERALATEIARTKIYFPHCPLFTAQGQEASAQLLFAAVAASISDKIVYWGFMTRIRVLPGQVDREIGSIFDYGKGNWQNVWKN